MNLIERAMEILERDGWCQREMHKTTGEHCMMGAVGKAAHEAGETLYTGGNRTRFDEAFDALQAELAERSTVLFYVPLWNDASGRTVGEVLEFMRHAAKRLGSV